LEQEFRGAAVMVIVSEVHKVFRFAFADLGSEVLVGRVSPVILVATLHRLPALNYAGTGRMPSNTVDDNGILLTNEGASPARRSLQRMLKPEIATRMASIAR
jgi:hypothetical protein